MFFVRSLILNAIWALGGCAIAWILMMIFTAGQTDFQFWVWTRNVYFGLMIFDVLRWLNHIGQKI